MKKLLRPHIALLLVFLLSPPASAKKPAEDPIPNPDPGQAEYGATPNLSFPMIATDIIDIFYQKVWVEDDLEGEEGYLEIASSEWQVGYDEDGDGDIDNVMGNGFPVPLTVAQIVEDNYDEDGDYPGNEGFVYQPYIISSEGKTVDLETLSVSEEPNSEGEYLCTSIEVPDGIPDKACPIDMASWLQSMEPWYDQPVNMTATLEPEHVTAFNSTLTVDINPAENPNHIWDAGFIDGSEKGGANSWQADWVRLVADESVTDVDLVHHVAPARTIFVDFIDWGNPLENTIAPIVGQRFPVEMALYEKVASTVEGETWGTPMTGYNMGCLEYPSTRSEVFGTATLGTGNSATGVCFATVLTKKYFAEVWEPNGNITPIPIEPGIGPSGKINFASAGGGWIPTMSGWHRIWMHFNDPLISLEGAIVNNDEHYIMSTGYMAEELSKNKQELVGIVGNSTFIDVYVYPANGGRKK